MKFLSIAAPIANRRLVIGVTTFDMSAGYARCVDPWSVLDQFYMLGDHGPFCPIQFR